MKNAIILCSGGIDSVTASYYVKNVLKYKNIVVLFFNYGQSSIFAERKYSKYCAEKLNANFIEIRIDFLSEISKDIINKRNINRKVTRADLRNSTKESERWYFPCRNSVFIVCAVSLAEFAFVKENRRYDIFTGFKCEGKDSYPDATKEFLNKFNSLNKISTKGKFKIIAPLINKDKEDIIILGKKLGINFENTYSCYIGKKIHCGHCLACRLRQEGFYWANLKDQTKYKIKMKDFRIV